MTQPGLVWRGLRPVFGTAAAGVAALLFQHLTGANPFDDGGEG